MPIGERFPQVLSAATEGSDAAWVELYHDLAPGLLRFLQTQGAPEPEDVLGEVFVQLVRNLHGFTGDEASFRAWAFTIARSRLVDAWRAGGRRPSFATGDVVERIDRRQSAPAADGALLERDAALAALGALTGDQRTVLLLRVLDQFSVAETAVIMRRSEGAVKVLQNRAVRALRKTLGGTGSMH